VRQLSAYLASKGMPSGVDAISAEHVAEYLASLAGRYKASSQRARHAALVCFFDFLVAEREIDENPIRRLARPKVPFEVRPGFTDAELTALFDTVRGSDFLDVRDRAIFSVMLSAGLRANELCAINTDDLINAGPQFRVVIHGKGGKKRLAEFGLEASASLRRYYRRRKDLDGEALFVSRTGDRLTTAALKAIFSRRGREAGITNCHPHRLRRSFALEYLRAGGQAESLRALMGHSDMRVLRQYTAQHEEERAMAEKRAGHDPADRLLGR
jgi:site-specific recombinase XerD